MATTPAKDISLEGVSNKGASDSKDIDMKGAAGGVYVNQEKEPTLKEVLCAINQLHVKIEELGLVKKDIDNLDDRLTNVEDSVDHCTGVISTIKHDQEDMAKDISLLKSIIVRQQAEINSLQSQTADLQARSMRNNLLFHGLLEVKDENCEMLVRRELEKHGIKEHIHIERIHRLGVMNPNADNPRPIVAKFPDHDFNVILEHAKKFPRDKGFFITRQFPQEFREKRSKMRSTVEEYKAKDNTCKTKITHDGKLYVNGNLHKTRFVKPSVQATLALSPSDIQNLTGKYQFAQGKQIFEGGSSFSAAAIHVKNINEAREAYQAFLLKPACLAARHNIGVYRVFSPVTSKTEEEWEDDHDHGAGRVLKDILHKKNITNVALFVRRGTDSTRLGHRRTKCLVEAAISALDKLESH